MATDASDGSQTAAVVVPDGYTVARVTSGAASRTSSIGRNIVFVVHRGDILVELTGDGRKTLRFPIEDMLNDPGGVVR